jgi:hypothetical protein
MSGLTFDSSLLTPLERQHHSFRATGRHGDGLMVGHQGGEVTFTAFLFVRTMNLDITQLPRSGRAVARPYEKNVLCRDTQRGVR